MERTPPWWASHRLWLEGQTGINSTWTELFWIIYALIMQRKVGDIISFVLMHAHAKIQTIELFQVQLRRVHVVTIAEVSCIFVRIYKEMFVFITSFINKGGQHVPHDRTKKASSLPLITSLTPQCGSMLPICLGWAGFTLTFPPNRRAETRTRRLS